MMATRAKATSELGGIRLLPSCSRYRCATIDIVVFLHISQRLDIAPAVQPRASKRYTFCHSPAAAPETRLSVQPSAIRSAALLGQSRSARGHPDILTATVTHRTLSTCPSGLCNQERPRVLDPPPTSKGPVHPEKTLSQVLFLHERSTATPTPLPPLQISMRCLRVSHDS